MENKRNELYKLAVLPSVLLLLFYFIIIIIVILIFYGQVGL